MNLLSKTHTIPFLDYMLFICQVTLCPVCANCSNLYYNESDQSTVPGWPPFSECMDCKEM